MSCLDGVALRTLGLLDAGWTTSVLGLSEAKLPLAEADLFGAKSGLGMDAAKPNGPGFGLRDLMDEGNPNFTLGLDSVVVPLTLTTTSK